MRLVDWNEFITLPAGTIYSEVRNRDGVRMKGDTTIIGGETFDYDDTSLPPTVMDADSIFHGYFEDIDKGQGDLVMVHPVGWSRNGMYDKTRKYWVWDLEDRERLARWLLNPEAVADGDELNEDNIRWRGNPSDLR